jgi:hypothetical protein
MTAGSTEAAVHEGVSTMCTATVHVWRMQQQQLTISVPSNGST